MDRVGVTVIVAVLVVGTIAGLWRRRTDGRFRTVPYRRVSEFARTAVPDGKVPATSESGWVTATASPAVEELTTVDAVESGSVPMPEAEAVRAQAAAGGATEEPGAADGESLPRELLAGLGVEPAQATLLQFSSAFCAPCRAVRRVSAEVAAMVPGVRHVEIDAESHLDAVRTLGIWRTPTLLVIDAGGRVVKRATGVPSKPQLIAVLGELDLDGASG